MDEMEYNDSSLVHQSIIDEEDNEKSDKKSYVKLTNFSYRYIRNTKREI